MCEGSGETGACPREHRQSNDRLSHNRHPDGRRVSITTRNEYQKGFVGIDDGLQPLPSADHSDQLTT